MDVVLSRLRRWRIVALPVLWMVWMALGSFAASAQELEAPARQTVERAAQQVAAVVARAVPDQTHTILYVEPVLTDEQRRTRLGARLRGVLQVTLVRHYIKTRLLEQPTASAPTAAAVRVVVELQPFDHHVTALVRILDRDGLLVDADLVDMPRSAAISALLQPDTWLEPDAPQLTLPVPEEGRPDPTPSEPASDRPASPQPPPPEPTSDRPAPPEPPPPEPASDRPTPPEPPPPEPAPDRPTPPQPPPPEPAPDRPAPPQPPPDRFPAPTPPEPPPAQALAAPAPPAPPPTDPAPPPADPTPGLPEDAYEPDDAPGFEVPVPAVEDVRFERTLTDDDRDRFELSLPAAAAVTVAIEAEIETLIALYLAGNAVPIGVHDRGFSGVLEAGAYLIEILAANAATTGAYALAVSTSPEPAEAAGPAEPGAQPEAVLPPSGSAPAAEGAGGAEALAQATELQSGESQERLMRQPPEWLQLTADPGFYGVTVTSAAETLRASLHRTRDEPAFLQLVPSAAGEQVGALFIGADLPVLRIDAPEADPGLRYSVAFEPVSPPRAFADQTWVEQAELGSLKHHTLRIISRDVYQLSMESASTSAASAEVEVLHVPAMRRAAPQAADVSRFDLPPGDYLILLRPLGEGTVGRVCWHLAQGSWNCS